jgi:RNA polymerase sigma-70 factor (ECF subfamily)
VPIDDELLLDAWRAGDAGAGSELLDRHFRSLRRFFHTKVGAAADDLVQEVMLALVAGARDRFRGDAAFRTYLFATARHVLFQHFARSRRDQVIDFGVSSVHDLGPSPSSVAALRQEQRLIVEALQRLPLDNQVAIELYYAEGLRGPELAEILGIAEPAVRSRLHRGLSQLRREVARLSAEQGGASPGSSDAKDWTAVLRADVERSEGDPETW